MQFSDLIVRPASSPLKKHALYNEMGCVETDIQIVIVIIIEWPARLQKFLLMLVVFGHGIYVVVSLEAPVYLSSQSYMADSSLSEEMSQFDFSTGVQSFSFSSQNPEGHRRTVPKRVE